MYIRVRGMAVDQGDQGFLIYIKRNKGFNYISHSEFKGDYVEC